MSMETIKTECQAELAQVQDAKQLADFWTKYLSKSGEVQKLMGGIKNVPNEEKKAYGQAVNEIKNWVQGLYDEKKIEIEVRDIKADNPSKEELKKWIERSGLDIRRFFNTSGLAESLSSCAAPSRKSANTSGPNANDNTAPPTADVEENLPPI